MVTCCYHQQTDRHQTGIQTDSRQTADRQTDRQTDRQQTDSRQTADRQQTDRQTRKQENSRKQENFIYPSHKIAKSKILYLNIILYI